MTDAFTDFLLRQVPKYDEAILRDMRGTVSPRPVDVRLLPNRLRKVARMRLLGCGIRFLSRWLKMPYSTCRRRCKVAERELDIRLNQWLKSLSFKKRKKEESKRCGDMWIGEVQTGKWKSFTRNDAFERVYVTYPDLQWPKPAP